MTNATEKHTPMDLASAYILSQLTDSQKRMYRAACADVWRGPLYVLKDATPENWDGTTYEYAECFGDFEVKSGWDLYGGICDTVDDLCCDLYVDMDCDHVSEREPNAYSECPDCDGEGCENCEDGGIRNYIENVWLVTAQELSRELNPVRW